jgi:hypothetical protein
MRRALIVGIDHYASAPLQGCVADAASVADVLSSNADGSRDWSVDLLVSTADGSCTIRRDVLRGRLTKLFANPRNTDLLFYFAGHGAQSPWGADLVTQDFKTHSLAVSMNDVLTLANDSSARSVTLILDCCFSGDTGNPPGLQSTGVEEAFRLGKTLLRENVTVLAASRSMETSAELDGHGVFTRALLDGLEGGATDHLGRITALGLYEHISPSFDAWEQRPVLKTSMTEPLVLRLGPPWLDTKMLRALTDHFPTEDYRLTLSPEHEGEGRPLPPGTVGTLKQQQFDYLGRLRNANLVTNDGQRDHFWLAMQCGEVYLTPLGRYFWRLAARKLL